MSPQEIRNPELYYDHFIQHWHRRTFGPEAWAIDLDLVGACQRCADSLYLIEATRSADKSTRIMRKLAEAVDVPSILVRHDDAMIVRATWQNGSPKILGGEEELKDAIGDLRSRHTCQVIR